MVFKVSSNLSTSLGARRGCYSRPGKRPVETPHFIVATSRGVIPHITPDIDYRNTNVDMIYIAMEDFIESLPKQEPPILSKSFRCSGLSFNRFLSKPTDQIIVLSARRASPVRTPGPNTTSALVISTSVGFHKLPVHEYVEACNVLRPDIIIGPADISYGAKPGIRRSEKSTVNTEQWVKDTIKSRQDIQPEIATPKLPDLFVPLLPIAFEQQNMYVDVVTDLQDHIDGLAIYDADLLPNLPQSLNSLPRLSLADVADPHAILHQVSLGIDLQTISFVELATDAGIALTFRMPPASASLPQRQTANDLGINMHEERFGTDMSPLMQGCACATCTHHHKAYIQHLLTAKEMLAWVLLQVHNLAVLEEFFLTIRISVQQGTFQELHQAFSKTFAKDFPIKTGRGPRVRGYQFKSENGDTNKNNAAFTKRL